MSGPKWLDDIIDFFTPSYFSFNTDDLKAAEVVRRMKSIYGVSFSVKSGKIQAKVAGFSSYTRSDMQNAIDEAMRQVREDKKWMENDKNNQQRKINNQIQEINKKAENLCSNLQEEIERLDCIKVKMSGSFATKYKSYSMVDDIEMVDANIERLNKDINRIRKEASKEAERLKDSISAILSCNEYETYCKLVKKTKDRQLNQEAKVDTNALAKELDEKVETLSSFCDLFNSSLSNLRDAGLLEYEERFEAFSQNADPFSLESIAQLNQLITDIQNQVESLEELRKIEKNNKQVLSELDKKINILNELSDILKPITVKMTNFNKNNVAVLLENQSKVDEADELLKRVSAYSFISNDDKVILNEKKDQIRRCRTNLLSEDVIKYAESIISELRDLEPKLKEKDDLYNKYNDKVNFYRGLYESLYKFDEQSKEADDDAIECGKFEFLYERPDLLNECLENLDIKIAKLQEKIRQMKYQSAAVSIANAVNGKIVYKEVDEVNQITKIGFVRDDAKGVIFDVQINKNGKTAVYPRGVILDNGTNVCTEQQLRNVHSSCKWSEELVEKANATRTNEIKFTEISDEVTESMYNISQYKRLNAQQTLDFLELSQYSEDEIESFGYGQSSNEYTDTNQTDNYVENKMSRKI